MELRHIFLVIDIFSGMALIYLAVSLFVGIATYKKIMRNTKKRHWGILLGKNKPRVAAIMLAVVMAMKWSIKIIKMSGEEVERELDIEFAPTHLI